VQVPNGHDVDHRDMVHDVRGEICFHSACDELANTVEIDGTLPKVQIS